MLETTRDTKTVCNLRDARNVVDLLLQLGCREALLCPGARNQPLIDCITSAKPFPYFSHFEERSAAFFALGRARALEAPVAVITTSGTAAAELLPAMIEAHYTGDALIAVTADRPKRYRGTGAPQAIEQQNLFTPYGRHINVCFEDPVSFSKPIDPFAAPAPYIPKLGDDSLESLCVFLQKVQKPLVIVSTLRQREREAVRVFLEKLKAPIYLEATSNLREHSSLAPYRLPWPDSEFDGVLRIGGVPTHRLWRDLEGFENVLSLTSLPFCGLPGAKMIHTDLTALSSINPPGKKRDVLTKPPPLSDEARYVRHISRTIPEESFVFLGNSLPIRHWDLAATYEERRFSIAASRGANGIDGQLSTFFALCKAGRANWGIFGDLTALYDMAAAWILPQIPDTNPQIIVINNKGGKIFQDKFQNPIFQNRHDLSFRPLADFWGLDYATSIKEPDRPRIVELKV